MKKTIKIIDLLNKIANGEEVPRLIRYMGDKYTYNSSVTFPHSYIGENNELFTRGQIYLTDEVEILDEEDEFEDIEEIPFDNGMKTYDISTYHQIERMTYAINDLIKNQKKIIDKLK